MHKILKAVPLAVMFAFPLVASAAASDADVQAMQQRIDALEAKLAAMEKLMSGQKATPAATNSESVTQSDFDDLKQKVNKQGLKLGKLVTDTYDGAGAGLVVTGYIDPTYVANSNAGSSSFRFLNNEAAYSYDTSQNGDVYLDIKKTFGEGLLAPNIEIVINPHKGYGVSNVNSTGSANPSIISQAVATVPITEEWSFTTGFAPGVAGYEYRQSNLNNAISHNLLYDFSAPASMIGVGLAYQDTNYIWSGKIFIGNEEYYTAGYQVNSSGGVFPTTDSNTTPSLMARIDYQATSAIDIGGSVFIGNKTNYNGLPYVLGTGPCAGLGATPQAAVAGYGYQCGNTSPFGQKTYAEVDMTATNADSVYNLQLDYGTQDGAAWNGNQAVWWGVSATAHKKWVTAALGKIGATIRLDYLGNDQNGGGGGSLYIPYGTDTTNGFGVDPVCLAASVTNGVECAGTNRSEMTLAFMVYPKDQLTLKAEFRRDWASTSAFLQSNGAYTNVNNVISLQSVYAF